MISRTPRPAHHPPDGAAPRGDRRRRDGDHAVAERLDLLAQDPAMHTHVAAAASAQAAAAPFTPKALTRRSSSRSPRWPS